MQILKILFLVILLLQSSTQTGCLYYNSKFECQLCDFVSGFSTSTNNDCVSSPIPNCEVQSVKKQCLKCDPLYYYDSNSAECITVEHEIDNCLYYSKDNQCKQCVGNYFLNNAKCQQVENEIEGCALYTNTGKCSYCNTGNVMSLDGTQCVKLEKETENCLAYNYIFCGECEEGFIVNPSLYGFGSGTDLEARIFSVADKFRMRDQLSPQFKVCQAKTVKNCKQFESFDKCKLCESGYYLSENLQCNPYPDSIIANCLKYFSLDKCKQCEQGFHLNDNAECEKNQQIENCEDYDAATQTTVCTLCKNGFYVSNNKCVARANGTIDKCQKYDPLFDICSECEPEYIKTTDKLKCLPQIERCLSYANSDLDSTSLQCSICEKNYYLTEQKDCALGSIQNCELLDSSTSCNQCVNQYYLNEETCLQHINLMSCEVYHETQASTCKTCMNNAVLMELGALCAPAITIQGCQLYLDEENCDVCKQGYRKITQDNKQICILITDPPNCLKLDSSNTHCDKCKDNYTIFPNPLKGLARECRIPQPHYNLNCKENNLSSGITDWKSAKCLLCEENFIPFDQKNQFVCMGIEFVHALVQEAGGNTDIKVNCQKMTLEGNNYVCVKCLDGYVLQSGLCKVACVDENGQNEKQFPVNFVELESFEREGVNELRVKRSSSCSIIQNLLSDTYYLCALLAPVYANNNNSLNSIVHQQKCVKCVEGAEPIISISQNMFNSDNFQPLETVSNVEGFSKTREDGMLKSPVLFKFPFVKCASSSSNILNSVLNCEQYREISGKYYCARCRNFYKGLIAKKDNKYYISSCTPFSECTALEYPGLPAILNLMATCFECFDGKIPIVFANPRQDPNSKIDIADEYFTPYNPDDTLGHWASNYSGESTAVGLGYTSECYDRNSQALAIGASFPLQCALGLYWVEADGNTPNGEHMKKQFNVDPTKIRLICGACKPGYKRQGSFYGIDESTERVKYMISDCVEIENCARSHWFNYCTECNSRYAFAVINKRVKYDQCVYTPDANCFAIDPSTNKCQICRRGFIFNYDNVCELFKPPLCHRYSQFDSLPSTMISSLLYLYADGAGCNLCEDSYLAVKVTDRTLSCIPSLFPQSSELSNSSRYIKNCKLYYQESNELRCNECLNNYVLNNLFTICYSKNSLSNCLIALDSEKCLKCKNDFVAVNYQCKQKTITNCANYDEDASLLQQTCILCASGFYLKQNACFEGSVEFCETYGEDESRCNKCQQGYQKIQIKGADYCLQIDSRGMCLTVDPIKFQNQILECATCLENQGLFLPAVPNNPKDKTLCVTINEISNCLRYDSQPLFQNSSLQCSECITGFYSGGYKCLQLKNLDINCARYEKKEDRCEECIEGFFLNTNFKCQKNPSGIKGCEEYTNETTCKRCGPNLFLQSNTCLEVSSDKRVENCEYYENPEVCQFCIDGYLLKDNKCLQILALNCLTVEDINTCLTCPPLHGLKTENGKVNCVKITDSNCLQYEPEFPFFCLLCAFGFYPDDGGVCQSVTIVIENCLSYRTANSCQQCRKGYVLSPDLIECVIASKLQVDLDPNCKISYQSQSPTCTLCEPGYYLKADYSCQKCEAQNCLFCDSSTPTKCTVCQFGYYMNLSFECKGEVVDSGGPVQETTNGSISWDFTLILLILLIQQ